MALRDLGIPHRKDWDLVPVIAEGRWTFVTRNARDFRGPQDRPGSRGQYVRLPEHEGLICLNGPTDGMDLRVQKELFRIALEHLASDEDPRGADLANQVLEITLGAADADTVEILRYDLPSGSWGVQELRSRTPREA